jgi:hypothetical protein
MFGCIYVPDFPVQVALLDEPQGQALTLVDGPESLLKVVSANKGAVLPAFASVSRSYKLKNLALNCESVSRQTRKLLKPG